MPSVAYVHIGKRLCVCGLEGVCVTECTRSTPPPPHPPTRMRACVCAQFMGVWNACPTNGSKQEDVACPSLDTGLFAACQ